MTQSERVALGIRRPSQGSIEYAIVEQQSGEGLLAMLRSYHADHPQQAFHDLADGHRLFQATDSIALHDAVCRAGAKHWFLHQGGDWQGGPVKRRGGLSLISRWHNAAAGFGGDRFHPNRFALNEDGSGLRRNCILGILVELFRDDYPTALRLFTSREGLPNGYIEYGGGEIYMHSLPPAVQRTVGLTTCLASFQLDHGVAAVLERNYGASATQIGKALPNWDLMALNDHALNWPASAELIAMPAPGLFA